MGTKTANVIALMSESQFNSQVPESLKLIAWNRNLVNGEMVYTSQSWKEMSQDAKFLEWYGTTEKVLNATYKGVNIGDRYIVKGRMSLKDPNVFGLKDANLDYIMSPKEIEIYLNNG